MQAVTATGEPDSKRVACLSLCRNALLEKKAEKVVVLDLRGVSSMADFFIICHGSSSRQVTAISDSLEKAVRNSGMKNYHTEGQRGGRWVLVDLGDIVVHVFSEDAREFYALEKLWVDARELKSSEMNGIGVNDEQ